MPYNIELHIQNQIRQGERPTDIIHNCLKDLYSDDTEFEDKNHILNFLLNCGQDQEVMMYIVRCFRKRRLQHWAIFFELLGRHKIQGSKKALGAILEGIGSQEAFETASKSYYSEGIDKRFRIHRKQLRDQAMQAWQERVGNLRDKLAYVKSQHMLEEEKKVIEQWLAVEPENAEARAARANFEQRWADQIIFEKAKLKNFEFTDPLFHFQLSTEERELLNLWLNEVKTVAQKSALNGANLAMMFIFFGELADALTILQVSPRSEFTDWLRLELLIDLRRFVEALDWVTEIEQRLDNQIETGPACAYARARCFYGLGQTGQAITVLQALLEIRPDYRMCRAWLSQWAESDNQ